MAILVRDIVDRAKAVLVDEDLVHTTEPELLYWINDVASDIVTIRPAAGSRTETFDTQEGVYQEPITEGLIMSVRRNLKADGSPGKPVTEVDRALIDAADPGWYGHKLQSAIDHFMFDDRNPRAFYNYPPVKAGQKLEVMYQEPPAKVTSQDDSLNLDASYMTAMISGVVSKALQKDSEYGEGQIAMIHQQAFMAALGVKNQMAVTTSPRGPLDEAT